MEFYSEITVCVLSLHKTKVKTNIESHFESLSFKRQSLALFVSDTFWDPVVPRGKVDSLSRDLYGKNLLTEHLQRKHLEKP